ncbi:CRAL TRIO domain protein [Seminavis robusta]|uniref:CRAL TRIO domain protein n=1 Tax=Seminavis robusta TaxID=568900 RepID=A0A9N8ELD6_9STRA|nr:CRAL TRIO domain protein [Seminavis robusta]|eukprot:Sro1390_g268670.1 CRAL TRIO domain protein (309) ;mRNA; f:19832-20758
MESLQFDNDDQEKACHDLLKELSEAEVEAAALTSFHYALVAAKEANSPSTEGKNTQQKTQCALRMIRRHLVAQKNNREDAMKSVHETLEFRNTNRVNDIRSVNLKAKGAEDDDPFLNPIRDAIIADAVPKPKMIVRGNDNEGRATLIKFQNSRFVLRDNPDLFIQVQIYWVERAIACSERHGQEKINLVMDYTGYSRDNKPPVSLLRRFITTLQSHYPERLHLMVGCDPTLLLRSIWSVVSWFVDPDTREKIMFVSGKEAKMQQVFKHYEPEQAMAFLLPSGTLGLVKEDELRKFIFEYRLDQNYDGH